MKRKPVLFIVVTSLLLATDSPAGSVGLATNTMARSNEPTPAEQLVYQKLNSIMIPEAILCPPATLVDAIDFLRQASRDYDNPTIPEEQRGVNMILKLPPVISNATVSATAATEVPRVPSIRLRWVPLHDALDLVCDMTGMAFLIRGNIVMIVPRNDPMIQAQTRSDPLLLKRQYLHNKIAEKAVLTKLKTIVLPQVTFRPPATLADFVDFLRASSMDNDDPNIPLEKRGVNVVLNLAPSTSTASAATAIPVMPTISVRSISLYDVLKLVCDATDTKIQITGSIVRIVPRPGREDNQAPAPSKTSAQ
jgi:hypothetical protein